MKLKYDFLIQQVADDFVAVAVGDGATEFNGLVRLNKTGRDIFELLQQGLDENAIVAALFEKYDASEELLREKVQEFTSQLSASGILES